MGPVLVAFIFFVTFSSIFIRVLLQRRYLDIKFDSVSREVAQDSRKYFEPRGAQMILKLDIVYFRGYRRGVYGVYKPYIDLICTTPVKQSEQNTTKVTHVVNNFHQYPTQQNYDNPQYGNQQEFIRPNIYENPQYGTTGPQQKTQKNTQEQFGQFQQQYPQQNFYGTQQQQQNFYGTQELQNPYGIQQNLYGTQQNLYGTQQNFTNQSENNNFYPQRQFQQDIDPFQNNKK